MTPHANATTQQALLGLYVIHCEGAPLPPPLAADAERAAALARAGGLGERLLAKAAAGVGRSVCARGWGVWWGAGARR